MSSVRANDLAIRLEQGAAALAAFASGLTDIDWGTRQPHDGRPIGVIVHHVASQYVIEIQLAQLAASGRAIEGVGWDAVDGMNAKHAADFSGATKTDALALLRRNS